MEKDFDIFFATRNFLPKYVTVLVNVIVASWMTHEKRTKCAKFVETQQNIFIQTRKKKNIFKFVFMKYRAVWPKQIL